MTAPYYTLPDDELRTGLPVLQRIGLTLHARACCTEALQDLLCTQPMVKSIKNHSRGTKGALERFTECYLYTWTQFGPLTFGENAPEGGDQQTQKEVYYLARTQSVRLLRSLGKIVSLLACLYCQVTHVDMDAVHFLINNIAQRELPECNEPVQKLKRIGLSGTSLEPIRLLLFVGMAPFSIRSFSIRAAVGRIDG